MYYAVFETIAGWVGIEGSVKGLRRATLPLRTEQAVCRTLGIDPKSAAPSGRLDDLVGRYRAYFSGHYMEFPDKLDLEEATPFRRAVWQATRRIPFGQTRSYAWVANRIGNARAVRAVGQALAANPLPVIVPCHRVLASNGGLGGFSGGLDMKRFLLKLETAPA
jgi:methylated-DNA-[protein]-cysteine S-methyltransferase